MITSHSKISQLDQQRPAAAAFALVTASFHVPLASNHAANKRARLEMITPHEAERAEQVRVVMTIMEGRVVYERTE